MIWMYFALRLAEVRSTGGNLNDVCFCGGGYGSSSNKAPVNTEYTPTNDDEDVIVERNRVANWDWEKAVKNKSLSLKVLLT